VFGCGKWARLPVTDVPWVIIGKVSASPGTRRSGQVSARDLGVGIGDGFREGIGIGVYHWHETMVFCVF
jgi:hypothetical protein